MATAPWKPLPSQKIVADAARPVSHKSLPPIPSGLKADDVTLVLFYQYIEPPWNKKQHREAMSTVTNIAREHGVCGRGRCAPEGLNCTLTGSADGVRSFCEGLRTWNRTFQEADFKLTDGIASKHRFKSLTLRKVDELVGYGMAGVEKAPELGTKPSIHLEADEFHKMMIEEDDDTVIIDVRNSYESAIGHFAPPKGGASLIDPKMRNSHDFPGWLTMPDTQKKLNGKRVMMYCTGGIRCERASALLGEVQAAVPNFETKGIFELRGGIERYMKTFPEGGAWKGKNYVFDRRLVQVPDAKPVEALQRDVESRCAGCRKKWDVYRGRTKCVGRDCGVPVILCPACDGDEVVARTVLCELCREGYKAPPLPKEVDLGSLKVAAKRKREEHEEAMPSVKKRSIKYIDDNEGKQRNSKKGAKKAAKKANGAAPPVEKEVEDSNYCADDGRNGVATRAGVCDSRIFVGKLPLTVDVEHLREVLSEVTKACDDIEAKDPATLRPVKFVHWITDKTTGAFYGSAFVQMSVQHPHT